MIRALLAAALPLLLLSSCGEADLPQRSLQPDDCLRDIRLDQLPQAIARCNQVVAAFPADPAPRNERSVLLALAGDDAAACRDIETAQRLVARAARGSLDKLLVSEVAMRQRSCLSQR